ncbi:hypothetical protein J3F84DRAFT_240176 [Trichoderma pleuroticola]
MVASMLPGYVILLIYLYTQMQGRKAPCTRTRYVCTEVLCFLAAVQHSQGLGSTTRQQQPVVRLRQCVRVPRQNGMETR